jgi:flagellar basal-body rod modification protein FlgD
MTTQPVASAGGVDFTALAAGTSPAQGATSGSDDIENRFLTLIVTQLKSQDPLNPMDNAQLTTQLAQISTVSGIEKLNTSLQAFAASSAAAQSLQASAMLGQSVLVPGSALVLQDGAASGGVSLPSPADRVVVTVSDAAGNLVQQIDLGAQPAGIASYVWDGSAVRGSARDGTYVASVSATRGGQSVAASPLAAGRVTAVSPAADGAHVTVAGVGDVALSDVKQVRP